MNLKFPLLQFLICLGLALCCLQCSKEIRIEADAELLVPHQDGIPGQYIVRLKDAFMSGYTDALPANSSRAEKGRIAQLRHEEFTKRLVRFLNSLSIDPSQVLYSYSAAMLGFTAQLSEDELSKVLKSPLVDIVEQDSEVRLPDFTVESVLGGLRAQSTPCGITNAGGSADGSASNLWIWIVDTGIDLDHPDLDVITDNRYAKSFVRNSSSPDDCNGHGTHCAGIAAAVDNNIGVIGVSAGAKVVPVRVLNCQGSGQTSWILNGLNHVATYDEPGDVVNLSLGGYWGNNCSTQSSYVSILTKLSNDGTRVAIAAGNSSANAALYTPACVNAANLHTVASMTCAKAWSSFSNFGIPPIDWIATGSSVYSTYLNGGYATLSGTSMAAPHVAGIMHNLNSAPLQNGTVTHNGVQYKIAVRQ